MTNVTERPILFSGPMVRAILDGRKTQTRRVVKPQPPEGGGPITVERYEPAIVDRWGEIQPGPEIFGAYNEEWGCVCPYGEPGDRLWVRETWRPIFIPACGENDDAWSWTVKYAAGGDDFATDDVPGDWTYPKQAERGNVPGIHMPRWASRITLEVTGVRFERLQEITEDDAVREGVSAIPGQDFWSCFCEATHDSFDMTVEPDAAFRREHGITHVKHDPAVPTPARVVRARLWDQTNVKRPGCLWADDPYVWVVDFRRAP